MNEGQMAFSQFMAHGWRFVLDRCIRSYDGNRRILSFSVRDMYPAMSLAQFTGTHDQALVHGSQGSWRLQAPPRTLQDGFELPWDLFSPGTVHLSILVQTRDEALGQPDPLGGGSLNRLRSFCLVDICVLRGGEELPILAIYPQFRKREHRDSRNAEAPDLVEQEEVDAEEVLLVEFPARPIDWLFRVGEPRARELEHGELAG